MTWITDNKDSGPWEFTEQGDKWGYLNNPKWSNHPKAAADSMSASKFCEGKGIALDPIHTHKPCGHWHKDVTKTTPDINIGSLYWYQPSVDVYKNKIGFVSMRYEDDAAVDGIVAMIYDIVEETWTCLGVVYGMYVLSSSPNTCRIAEDYMAYYCSCYDYAGDYYAQRLYIFKEGEDPTYIDVFKWEWATKSPYYVDAEQIYNTMDCFGDRIACTALAFYKDGNVYDKMLIKVSNNGGSTFPVEWAFPARTATDVGYWDRAMVRMSEDGIVWVCYVRAMGSTTMVELWKSNSGATSWTKIWEKDYYSDLNDMRCINFSLGITEVDGEYITIQLYGGNTGIVGSRTYYNVIYTSSDYGVSFNTKQDWILETYAYSAFATVNGQYIVKLARRLYDGSYDYIFYRSTDYGVNFSEVAAPLTGFYPDMQKYYNQIAYVECGEAFSPPAPSADYQSLLYSDDDGATWKVIQSPVQNTGLGADVIFPSTVDDIIIELDEPQVWPM